MEDLYIDNELIKNISLIKFHTKIEEIKGFNEKENKEMNEAYENEIFICNKILNNKKTNNNSEIKGTQTNSFFGENSDVFTDVLNLIKKKLEENPLDFKILKGYRKDLKEIELPKYILSNNSDPMEKNKFRRIIEKYLKDCKESAFLKLMRDLQYEYCIFKAKNQNLISYNNLSLDKSNSEERLRKNYFNQNDHFFDNSDNMYDEEEQLIDKVKLFINFLGKR
jgi:hypothetical protein